MISFSFVSWVKLHFAKHLSEQCLNFHLFRNCHFLKSLSCCCSLSNNCFKNKEYHDWKHIGYCSNQKQWRIFHYFKNQDQSSLSLPQMNYHQHYLHCSFCQKFGHHSIIFLWQALFLRDKNNALGTWANPSSSFLEKKIIFNSPLMKYDFMSKYQRIIQILFLRSTKTLEKIISFYLSEIEIFIQCSSLSWKILSFIS